MWWVCDEIDKRVSSEGFRQPSKSTPEPPNTQRGGIILNFALSFVLGCLFLMGKLTEKSSC